MLRVSNFSNLLNDIIEAGYGNATLNLRDADDTFYTVSSVNLIEYEDPKENIIRIDTYAPDVAFTVEEVHNQVRWIRDGEVSIYDSIDDIYFSPKRSWTLEDGLVIIDIEISKLTPVNAKHVDEILEWLQKYKANGYKGKMSSEIAKAFEHLVKELKA